MATPRSRQIFWWRRRRRLHFVFFFMLFYSIELLLVHITCLHIYYVYIYLHLLAQDARLCHGRGKDHGILWTIVNASGRLVVHGFGVMRSCMPWREASRMPSPQISFKRILPTPRPPRACDGLRTATTPRLQEYADRWSLFAGKLQELRSRASTRWRTPTMDKTMASPWTLWSPQVQPDTAGRRPQRRRRRLRSAQEGASIRRLGLDDSVPP